MGVTGEASADVTSMDNGYAAGVYYKGVLSSRQLRSCLS